MTVAADGSLRATNSDAFGFMANLESRAPDWRAARPALILGAGGGARAALVALLDAGVPEVRIANRTHERAQALARAFGPPARAVAWRERVPALEGAGLLVNATQLGMEGQAALEVALSPLAGDATVCDLVYAPLETALLRRARARRLAAVDGPRHASASGAAGLRRLVRALAAGDGGTLRPRRPEPADAVRRCSCWG